LTIIRKIRLTQYRNYNSSSFEFLAPVTCITGPNGSGKTNLLDAVYYLCYTKSYFTSLQQHTAQRGTDGFRIEGEFEREGQKETISYKWQQGRKELTADQVPYTRAADHIGKYAAVMIAPDDMELINDGGALRRKWVDSILGQADKAYLEALLQYQRILQQRNAWLKQEAVNPSPDRLTLDFYDSQLAAHGSYLHRQRLWFLEDFIPLLHEFYGRLCDHREPVTLIYESDMLERPLGEWLKAGLGQDLRMQRTLRGAHRDDWQFLLNGMPVRTFGSQGQKKSYLFALKLAQHAWLGKTLGHRPALLLDDIFEKLDQTRMEALLRIIRDPAFGQVLLTDTHADRVRAAFGDTTDIGMIRL
jgi:DNA replication and repair protein RecF